MPPQSARVQCSHKRQRVAAGEVVQQPDHAGTERIGDLLDRGLYQRGDQAVPASPRIAWCLSCGEWPKGHRASAGWRRAQPAAWRT